MRTRELQTTYRVDTVYSADTVYPADAVPYIKERARSNPTSTKQVGWPRWDINLSWEGAYPTKIKTQKRWTIVAHHKNLIMGRRRQ